MPRCAESINLACVSYAYNGNPIYVPVMNVVVFTLFANCGTVMQIAFFYPYLVSSRQLLYLYGYHFMGALIC